MRDPDRLAGHESDLGRLLVAANADTLEDEHVARVRESLVAAGALAAGAALHKLTALKLAKVLAGVLLVGGGGATAYLLLRSPPPRPTATLEAPAAPSIEPLPLAATSVEPVTTLQVEDLPESSAAPQKRWATATKPATSASTSAAVAAPPSPREGLLLLQARQSLARDPQRALDLVRQHEQEFPTSQLQPERTQLETEAIAAGAK